MKELKKKPSELKKVMELINSDDQRISMRASWVLLHFSFDSPEHVVSLLPDLLHFLEKSKIHTGSIRNCIRIFTVVTIPENYCSAVYDTCMRFLTNPKMPHAVRAFSIQAMLILCKVYPELGYELRNVIRHMTEETLPPSLIVWTRRADQWFSKTLTPQ